MQIECDDQARRYQHHYVEDYDDYWTAPTAPDIAEGLILLRAPCDINNGPAYKILITSLVDATNDIISCSKKMDQSIMVGGIVILGHEYIEALDTLSPEELLTHPEHFIRDWFKSQVLRD